MDEQATANLLARERVANFDVLVRSSTMDGALHKVSETCQQMAAPRQGVPSLPDWNILTNIKFIIFHS